MKTLSLKYFVIIIYFLVSYSSLTNHFAQQMASIQTPNGSFVPDSYYETEMSWADIQYYNNATIAAYPNATFLSNSSKTYNCHGYAWHVSEGGTMNCTPFSRQ